MSYETLDKIADAYNPTLFILYLGFSIWYWRKGDKLAWAIGLAGVVSCYLLMFIDNSLGLWKSLGMDYSTHTAVALSLLFFHVHKRKYLSVGTVAFVTSFAMYLILMHYQEYHTVADMISTILVVGALLGCIYFFRKSNHSKLANDF